MGFNGQETRPRAYPLYGGTGFVQPPAHGAELLHLPTIADFGSKSRYSYPWNVRSSRYLGGCCWLGVSRVVLPLVTSTNKLSGTTTTTTTPPPIIHHHQQQPFTCVVCKRARRSSCGSELISHFLTTRNCAAVRPAAPSGMPRTALSASFTSECSTLILLNEQHKEKERKVTPCQYLPRCSCRSGSGGRIVRTAALAESLLG